MSVHLKNAMVLAAGKGTRMQELSKAKPKPLIEVNNKTLIDYALDRVCNIGITSCVVNISYLGEQIRDHLNKRETPKITFSEEVGEPLETGGGVKKALSLLGDEPFLVTNSDPIWTEEGDKPALSRLADAFDADSCDIVILLQPLEKCIGHDGVGDYFIENGKPRRRVKGETSAPLVYAGAQILSPKIFEDVKEDYFSLVRLYDKAERKGRLGAVVHEGYWFHVGTPEALNLAEQKLR